MVIYESFQRFRDFSFEKPFNIQSSNMNPILQVVICLTSPTLRHQKFKFSAQMEAKLEISPLSK